MKDAKYISTVAAQSLLAYLDAIGAESEEDRVGSCYAMLASTMMLLQMRLTEDQVRDLIDTALKSNVRTLEKDSEPTRH